MTPKRRLILVLAFLAALTLSLSLAVACGGGGGEEGEAGQTSAPATGTDLELAIEQVGAMLEAAQQGDLEAAEVAFEDGHDPLHAVIDDLEASDPDLAAELDEAVDDAEKDFEEGADADHIVEIGNEILGLLEQVE